MDTEGRSISTLVKEIRRQLSLSQEDLARAAWRQLRDRKPMGKRAIPAVEARQEPIESILRKDD